jgi:hypothetical protein
VAAAELVNFEAIDDPFGPNVRHPQTGHPHRLATSAKTPRTGDRNQLINYLNTTFFILNENLVSEYLNETEYKDPQVLIS